MEENSHGGQNGVAKVMRGAPQPTISSACTLQHNWWCQICSARLTKMVVTIRVRLAKESVMLVDRSLLLSVMLRPLYEFQTPICTEESR